MKINLKLIILKLKKKLPNLIFAINFLIGYVFWIVYDIIMPFSYDNYYYKFLYSDNKMLLYIFLNSFMFMCFICYFITIYTDAGKIPNTTSVNQIEILIKKYLEEIHNNQENGLFRNLITFETIKKTNFNDKGFLKFLKNNDYKFCKFCFIIKPERAHHCRYCNSCYLKMDHHCHWIDNCIGLNNYKSFCLLVLYYELYLIIYTILFLGIFLGFYNSKVSVILFFFISLNFIVNILLLILNTLLLILHFFALGIKNQTTIEFCENKNNKDFYNRGAFNNYCEVFGNNILLWLIPINNNYFSKKMDYQNDTIIIKI